MKFFSLLQMSPVGIPPDGIYDVFLIVCPPGTEKLKKSPRQTKRPDNSVLHMFNNNTYSDFRPAYKNTS